MGFPIKYNFDPHYRGDTFLGIKFQLIPNEGTVDITGATAIMQLRQTAGNKVLAEWNTSDDSIEVDEDEIYVKPKEIDLPAFNYLYDLQLTYLDGKIQSIVKGLFPIVDDISRNQ